MSANSTPTQADRGPTAPHRRTVLGVENVAHEQRILARQRIVDPRQQVILIASCGVHFADGADAGAGWCSGQRVKRENGRDRGINRHRHSVHDSLVCVGVRHQRHNCLAQGLPQFFVIDEEKQFVLLDRPAQAAAN